MKQIFNWMGKRPFPPTPIPWTSLLNYIYNKFYLNKIGNMGGMNEAVSRMMWKPGGGPGFGRGGGMSGRGFGPWN